MASDLKITVTHPTKQELYERAVAAVKRLRPDGVGCSPSPAADDWNELQFCLSTMRPSTRPETALEARALVLTELLTRPSPASIGGPDERDGEGMSTKTTYKCDRCGREFETRTGLRCFSMGFGVYSGDSSWERSLRMDWCLECLNEFGLTPPNNHQGLQTKIEPNKWEAALRELIREEIDAAGQGA